MIETTADRRERDEAQVRELVAGFGEGCDIVGLPAFLVAADGLIAWLNRAAAALFGPRTGDSYLDLLPYAGRDAARTAFAGALGAAEPSTWRLELVSPDGSLVDVLARVATVRGGFTTVGLLGIALPLAAVRPRGADVETPLTRRQEEVLQLLAQGLETDEIAERLGVALDTARNHIRAVLRQLDAHSRLEAVIAGLRRGYISLDP